MSKRFGDGHRGYFRQVAGESTIRRIKTAMNLSEFLEVLWRRKLIVLAVPLSRSAWPWARLRLATKQYEADSTVAVLPKDANSTRHRDLHPQRRRPDRPGLRGRGDLAGRRSGWRSRRSPAGRSRASSVDDLHRHADLQDLARDPSRCSPATAPRPDARRCSSREGRRARHRQVRLASSTVPAADDAVFPRPKLTLAVALLLGLGLGVGAALLRENLDDEGRDARGARAASPASRLRRDPERAGARARQDAGATSPTPSSESSPRRSATCARTCSSRRATCARSSVTSPEGSHGKTTVSFGLAVTFARSGAQTLLVDADLRGAASPRCSTCRAPPA